MKTLNKDITAGFFLEPGGYNNLRTCWRQALRNRNVRWWRGEGELTGTHYLLYLILLGKNWQKAFSPITNARKLKSGRSKAWGGRYALRQIHSDQFKERVLKPFRSIVRPDVLTTIRELLPPLEEDENPLDQEPYRD